MWALCAWYGMLAVSGQFASPDIAGNWQLGGGTFTLDRSGGNDAVLIDGLVSEFGNSWYKNCTSAAAGLFHWIAAVLILSHSIYVPMQLIYGVTYHCSRSSEFKGHVTPPSFSTSPRLSYFLRLLPLHFKLNSVHCDRL